MPPMPAPGIRSGAAGWHRRTRGVGVVVPGFGAWRPMSAHVAAVPRPKKSTRTLLAKDQRRAPDRRLEGYGLPPTLTPTPVELAGIGGLGLNGCRGTMTWSGPSPCFPCCISVGEERTGLRAQTAQIWPL